MGDDMELGEAIVVVGGSFVGFSTFTFAVVKFIEPIKKFFHITDKIKNIDQNYTKINDLDSRMQSKNEYIKSLQEDVSGIDSRLIRVENTLSEIKEGVKCLLGSSLGYENDPKGSEEIYRNLKKC